MQCLLPFVNLPSMLDVNVDVSKPADTLVKKVSKGVGGLFAPWQTKRMAKAEAESAIIRTQGEVEVSELQRRALRRFIQEEAQHQQNMEAILGKALPQLEDTAKPDAIEDDWVTNFFDKGRIVSDEEMQGLWARVLAGEANVPGSYSKRTVNFLADFQKGEADLFSRLCNFVWIVGVYPIPLIFDPDAVVYNAYGINFLQLTHLESIGLIRFDPIGGFTCTSLPKNATASYFNRRLEMQLPTGEKQDRIKAGHVLLSPIGLELSQVAGGVPVGGVFEYVQQQWAPYRPVETTQLEEDAK